MNSNKTNIPASHDKDEVPFSFEELFFSRTDSRGIVQSGNSVFQRISLYEWAELIKKPHNIIRHGDMPKGVFYLFWDFLKQGKPIGAYVKNRAKDGRYYWVFAIATPVEDGFLSVRLKPSSELLPVVQSAYKSLLAYENSGKVTPQQSAEKLLEDLKTLGFDSYEEFMAVAIGKEITSRDNILGLSRDKAVSSLDELMQEAKSLLKETIKIFLSYEESKYVPLNLRIQSSQLGDEGRTIGVISSNYNIVSTEIKDEINDFKTSAQDVFSKIFEGQFLSCTARTQQEVIEFFQKEETDDETAKAREMKYLQEQQADYKQKAAEGLREIIARIGKFQEDCRRMKMCASSLEVIRVMGKVDAARLSTQRESLNELINDLKLFQESIAESLTKIDQVNNRMRHGVQSVVMAMKAV